MFRIFGQDRYQTAAAISRACLSDGADTVVLTRGDSPADALTAVPLAGQHKAPLLLTPPSGLPDMVLEEIQVFGAKKVIIIGGPAAIPEAVLEAVKELMEFGNYASIKS